jgi:hypothetical protein
LGKEAIMQPDTIVAIDTRAIKDWDSFHSTFAQSFGFPDFYGRNMNAWIDCMTFIDDPDDRMSTIHAPLGGLVVLQLDYVADFARRCPEIYNALIDCTAFVNWRRIEQKERPVLVLSFFKNDVQ